MLGHLSIRHLLLISNNDNNLLKTMLYMSTMAMPNTKSFMQFYNHVCLKIAYALVHASSRRVSIYVFISSLLTGKCLNPLQVLWRPGLTSTLPHRVLTLLHGALGLHQLTDNQTNRTLSLNHMNRFTMKWTKISM